MSILQTKTGRRGALEIHIDELRKEFKKEAKEHSDNWMLLYSYNKGSINRFCYDGMAVDDVCAGRGQQVRGGDEVHVHPGVNLQPHGMGPLEGDREGIERRRLAVEPNILNGYLNSAFR